MHNLMVLLYNRSQKKTLSQINFYLSSYLSDASSSFFQIVCFLVLRLIGGQEIRLFHRVWYLREQTVPFGQVRRQRLSGLTSEA